MEKNSILFAFNDDATLSYEVEGDISADGVMNALAILAVKSSMQSGISVKDIMETCLKEYVPNAMLQLMIMPEVIEDA